jgi:hypothetical protein
MNRNAMSDRDIFWEILFYLEELKAPKLLSEFLSSKDIKKNDFFIFFEQSHFFGLVLTMKDEGHDHVIFPLSWHKDYGDIVLENCEYQELARDIQVCIETHRLCYFEFNDGSHMEVYPWRILLLENRLIVIAEDIVTKRLLTIEVGEVKDIELRGSDYRSLFSRLEVEDFIHAMRAVDGSDERLIIKIKEGQEIKMPSNLIFLGNPYTTTNQYGDIIWAASVEKSVYLYEWLYSIREKMEILDPSGIKNEFNDFCDTKKIA